MYTFQVEGDRGTIVEAHSVNLEDDTAFTVPSFKPQALTNLALVQDMESMAPVRAVPCVISSPSPPPTLSFQPHSPRSSADLCPCPNPTTTTTPEPPHGC
jgi:hypothetical protein